MNINKIIEDMKVDLSKMKSELKRKTDKKNQIYLSEHFLSNSVLVNETLENTYDLEVDVSLAEKLIDRLERYKNASQ